MATVEVLTDLIAYDGVNICGLDSLIKARDVNSSGLSTGDVLKYDSVNLCWYPSQPGSISSVGGICSELVAGDKTICISSTGNTSENSNSVVCSSVDDGTSISSIVSGSNTGTSYSKVESNTASGYSYSNINATSISGNSTVDIRSSSTHGNSDINICSSSVNGYGKLSIFVNSGSDSGLTIDGLTSTSSLQNKVWNNGGLLGIGLSYSANEGEVLTYDSNGKWVAMVAPSAEQADWNETNSTKQSFIKNKPADKTSLSDFDVSYSGIGDGNILRWNATLSKFLPSTDIGAIKSDWNETDINSLAYINNKPTVSKTIEGLNVNSSNIGAGKILCYNASGSCWDYVNICDSLVMSDWEELDNTKASFIRNKPTIPTVPSTLSGFDVDTTGIADNNILYWDDLASLWKVKAENAALKVLNSNWSETDPNVQSFIQNKPTIYTRVNDLLDVNVTSITDSDVLVWDGIVNVWKNCTISLNQKQADWNITDAADNGFIKNKPTFKNKICDMSDAAFTGLIDNQQLKWNTALSKWINFTPASIFEFSQTERDKLSGIANSANNYSHPVGNGNCHIPDNTGVTNGSVLISNGVGKFAWGNPSLSKISDMTDVNMANAGTGRFLTYDASNLCWDMVDIQTFSGNIFTNADKTKLDGIAVKANNYIHPNINGTMHVPANTASDDGKVLTSTGLGVYEWVALPDAPTSNTGPHLELGETDTTAYRGDHGKIAFDHSQTKHAPLNAAANVQSDWNELDPLSDKYIKNKPSIYYTTAIPDATVNNGGLMTASQAIKLNSVEPNATADMSNLEIYNAYNSNILEPDANEITDGTGIGLKLWSVCNVKKVVEAHSGSGGSGTVSNLSLGTINGSSIEINNSGGSNVTIPLSNGADAGLMSPLEHGKLNDIEANANNYSHPIGNGFNHVPENLVGDSGKVLVAGKAAGSVSWENNTPIQIETILFNNKSQIIVNHNLGKNPDINVYDSFGNKVLVEQKVLSTNTIEINSFGSFSGCIQYYY